MHPVYHGIRPLSIDDLAFDYRLEEAKKILENFHKSEIYDDINQIIDLSMAIYYLHMAEKHSYWDKETIKNFKILKLDINKKVGLFFSNLNNSNFLNYYDLLGRIYIEDFWNLIERYKVYKRINFSIIETILTKENFALNYILKQKNIVFEYDAYLSKYMINNCRTAEYLIKKYLTKTDENFYLPLSLSLIDKEKIVKEYICSEDPNVSFLLLISEGSNDNNFSLSDKTKLLAKRKYDQYWEKYFKENSGIDYITVFAFRDFDNETIKNEYFDSENRKTVLEYSKSWIKSNLEYATILNNFIFLFEFVDWKYRCNFIAINSELGVFEKFIGIDGKRSYKIGSAFNAKQAISNLQMKGYYYELLDNNINLDDAIKWFFECYLKEEFGVDGFCFNIAPKEVDILLKYKNLVSEMESILKQFSLYCENDEIDRELLEISSRPIIYSKIPTMQKFKYYYINDENKDINSEMNMLFSDQSTLGYTNKTGDRFNNFFDLIRNEKMKLSDFEKYQSNYIKFLIDRGSVFIDYNIIKLNLPRVTLLHELYIKEIGCFAYITNTQKEIIDKLIKKGEVKIYNFLFSKIESDYINFILNKTEFSNGYDLRNKYVHGTYPVDKDEQEKDYFMLLKIMIIIVLKINEEFCLKSGGPNNIKII